MHVKVITYMFIAVWLVWLVVPTIIFHPIFRNRVPSYWLPVDIASRWFAKGIIILSGIKIVSEGNISQKRTILICNYQSIIGTLQFHLLITLFLKYCLDPVILFAYSPVSVRFVLKNSTLYWPQFYLLFRLLGFLVSDKNTTPLLAIRTYTRKIGGSARSVDIFYFCVDLNVFTDCLSSFYFFPKVINR